MLTELQREAIRTLAKNYSVEVDESQFAQPFDLPDGWVSGWVGNVYVGISPEGEAHS